MGLTTDFNQVKLSGLDIKNPTSLQFGSDGRLYISQQDGIIKIAEVEAITDELGTITGYQVVGQIETINLVQDIPNHDDNGDLNTKVNKRQVTGLVVDRDAQGNVVLYVSSSDSRIGGGYNHGDKNLDTNSGIISRLTLTNPLEPLGDNRWTKTDLVIGLPRSEENHSTNGMDIRVEEVNGEEHQIMYVASGGNTNKGAPTNNFAWTPEYYYSAAVLRVDLTQLEQIEAVEGLKGGTEYVDSYVYALPTLNDPTRSDNAFGQDTANGTTGTADAEAADTFGGNNGRNQAKYDPNGPVQVYSMGYRNHYDVVVTEAGNIYTFDNGPNNGWGDRPITADGDPVYSSDQIGTNNPNINVDTGHDTAKDTLHLVTKDFYAGHPNPVYASGADAGLYNVDTSSGTPVVTKLTYPSDPANDPNTTADDLPSDWNTVSGGFTHPEADVYKKGPDNDDSLAIIRSSSNGLTEYTAGGVSDNPNGEVLVVAPFNGQITFLEIESDGTQEGTMVTDTKSVEVRGTPLDLTTVGGNGIDGSGQFAGTVWVAQFGANDITILTPGTPPPPDLDRDDDGLEDNIDPLQYDSANGVNTVLSAGQTLFWDFNPSDSGQNPGKGTSAEGPFNVGLTGWMIDGINYLDGLRDLDNTIRGGAPGIIQVKSVGSGDLVGSNNTQQDAIQTGFLPASNVNEFTIKVPIFNPFSSDANNGINWSDSASIGFALGDGSMSNFLQIAVSAANPKGSSVAPKLSVTYEENDLTITELDIEASELLNSIDDDLVELFLNVNLATYEVLPSWRFQTNGNWSEVEQIGNASVHLKTDGQIVKALQGQLYINEVQSAPVVTLTSTSNGSELFTADFLDLTIESSANNPDPETPGNPELTAIRIEGEEIVDTSVYRVENKTVASGGQMLSLIGGSGNEIGTATFTFNGASGLYNIVVGVFDENDGQGQLKITQNSNEVATLLLNQNLGSHVPNAATYITPTVTSSQLINTGDRFTITGFENNAEHVRFDFIEFRPVDSGSTTPELSINDVTIDEDASTAIFTVNLSEASSSEVTVDFATVEGSALAGSDYINNSGKLWFAAGETSKSITIDIIDDVAVENVETFNILLSNPSGANIADDTGIATIIDDDNTNSDNVIAQFEGIEQIDSEIAGQIGAARITITPGSNIQKSSFGTDSFLIKNIGDKRIAAVYFDVTNALFPDTVFDPKGKAGDSTHRGLKFSDTGESGAFEPGSKSLLPFYGLGGAKGYEGMLLTFDSEVSGGYETGEIIKFSVDMDPNSIAGLPQQPRDIDGNDPRLNSWDIGGVSGAELINSEVHVLFTDGTTALGELMGDGSQGGSVALVSQSSPNKEVTLTVNGIEQGGSGSYSQSNIQVQVSGQAGDVARVILAKGFIQPFDYVDPDGNAIDLSAKFIGEAFPANNAVQFQTVDVLLDGTVQDITSKFNFGAPGGKLTFSGDDELPVGLVASIIDSDKLPIGAVTEPIYLVHDDSNVSITPELTIDDLQVNEGSGTATFTVNLSKVSSSEVQVNFATIDDTAIAGEDYTATNGTLTFAVGETSQTIQVNLADDELDEVDETFKVQLTNASGAELAKNSADATIVDNDESVSVFESELLHRINVGGKEVAAADGLINWSEDTNANPSPYRVGNGGDRSQITQNNINLSDSSLPTSVPEAIFQTDRWDVRSGANMQWEFDVDPGKYEVKLYFAEIYSPIDTVGERVFDVAVEGAVPQAFDDIDIFASVGQYSGMATSYTTAVADGSLSLEFINGIQNPALKGIEILSVNEVFV